MTDEAALKLAAAMERLAIAIERATGTNGLQAGLQVFHHGIPSCQSRPQMPGSYGPNWSGQSTMGGQG